uniref:Uncharacterized protein n=1 Tax=Periophthalmus magnuspinnatus TaxID=409849 RepID=A0A3B3ZHM9_9GOBI
YIIGRILVQSCPLVAVSAVWMLLCSLALPVVSSPLCTGPVCPVASLANLFDRVIQHSARMHAISTSLHQDFVSTSNICWTWFGPGIGEDGTVGLYLKSVRLSC